MNPFSTACVFSVDLRTGATILKVCPILDRQVKLKGMKQRQRISKSEISRANPRVLYYRSTIAGILFFSVYKSLFSFPQAKINTSLFRQNFGQFYERAVTVERRQFLKRNYHLARFKMNSLW